MSKEQKKKTPERFRFKHFSVQHHCSTMKVGTDAVLLGSWAHLNSSNHILDIGTGCGILALMAAQRSDAMIDAIDIHAPSIEEAKKNFHNSPWQDRLSAHQKGLMDWCPEYLYDHILVNPPYYNAQLMSSSPEKTMARHGISLVPKTLARHSKRLLEKRGKISIVVQHAISNSFLSAFREEGFFPERSLLVSSFDGKAPVLSLYTFGMESITVIREETLTLYDHTGNRMREYANLTEDFYL